MNKLNIFYLEPDPDRWIKYDRYIRKLIRRVVRGKHKPGGIMMFTLQLLQGLDKIKLPYRFNNYKYARQHPDELVCINGKPHVLFDIEWKNPVLFGPGIYSHPLECPDLFQKYPNVKKIIVSCDWMKQMFVPYYGEKNIIVWPVGIDTEKWNVQLKAKEQPVDFLIYDKIRWEREYYENELLSPIINTLKNRDISYDVIKYGSYTHNVLINKLSKCKAVIFLCEHETQGLAYQQILATNTPILAWDRGGFWQDPQYYPDRVKFGPVSSVPYWDGRCGLKFRNATEFTAQLPEFLNKQENGEFSPRNYILENLTLERAATMFAAIANSITRGE